MEDNLEKYLSKIRTLGALNYDPPRICKLLELEGDLKEEFLMRISIPGDIVYITYENGRIVGEYNIDVELTKLAERGDIKAISILEERKKTRVLQEIKQQLFGL